MSIERTKASEERSITPSHPFTPSPLHPFQRSLSLERLQHDSFDLVVIGGGITGAGIALDAALRGLSVALIDKGDFASGTSAASSKLIHGGLRYLERLELGLVREALRERHTLLRLAPHLVRPLRIIMPQFSGVGRWRWTTKLGLSLYDWLAGPERIGRHRWLTAGELTTLAPGLRTDGLSGGFEFFDAQMDDARLCLEVVMTAAEQGAQAANYLEAVEIRRSRSGPACGCEVVDRLSGMSFGIAARRVVNAAGPWLDEVCHIDDGSELDHLAPTKGVHIVLPSMRLSAGLLITHPADGRVMFVLPWMNRTLVGTTDTFFEERPDGVAADAADVDYLLAAFNHYFGQRLSPSDVIATLAGLRPLLRGRSKNPSARSREFTIFRSRSGLWSIAGGKYTTYRRMAEKMVDSLVKDLGGSTRSSPCRTAEHRLIGAPVEDWSMFRASELRLLENRLAVEATLASHLVDRYGRRARLLVQELDQIPALWTPIFSGEIDIRAELQFQSDQEMAQCPADHLLRRTRLGLFHPELLTADLKWPGSNVFGTLT